MLKTIHRVLSFRHLIVGFLLIASFVCGLAFNRDSTLDKQTAIKNFSGYYETAVGSEKNCWLGVNVQQSPDDAWIMQEIINEVRPDFIIETGTYKGGYSLFFASILSLVNKKGKVITVDLTDEYLDESARQHELFKNNVELVLGSSISREVLDHISKRVKGRKTLVLLDSGHGKNYVLKEMKRYAEFVSVGSYLVVHDTNLNGHPLQKDMVPGPWEAVQEFLKTNDQFEIDHSRERLLITLSPSGFLKRIK